MVKLTAIIIQILIFSSFPFLSWSQGDSLIIADSKKNIWYFGGGIGACNKGGVIEYSFAMASANYWGGSINIRANLSKSDDVPSDYYDDGLRVIAPKDYLTAISFNFLKKFPTSKKNIRIGLEAGPAWVRNNIAQFESNPDYDPDAESDGWNWFSPNYLYYKSHDATSKIGFSFTARAEYIFARHSSLDLALYTVINGYQTIVGANLCVSLGRIQHL
jgi:hypothetical protein